MNVSFTVHSVPVGQPRARATAIGGHARMYSPTTTKKGGIPQPHPIVEFKHAVVMAFKATKSARFDGPTGVTVRAFFPRPKNRPADGPPKDVWKSGLPYRHTKKPDRDNLDKAILDALTGKAWADDKQVCCGMIEKLVCGVSETPRVEIHITEMGWFEYT
jgi:Holliday junction resolvase RusA-like endonuclease